MSLKPPPPPVKSEPGSFAWMDWYKKLYDYLNTAGSVIWSTINFTGSKLTDIGTRLHSNLQSVLGTGQYHVSSTEATLLTNLLANGHAALSFILGTGSYHVSSAEATLVSGLSSATGTGAYVHASSPTLTTPALGTPSALVGTNITGTATGLTTGGNALLAGSSSQAFSASTFTSSAAGSSIIVEASIAPTLLNSWVNYGAPFIPSHYYKDASSRVHIEAVVHSGVVGSPVFTLPVGYRPPATHLFAIDSNGAHGQVSVASNGDVTVGIGSNVYASLSGISFRV